MKYLLFIFMLIQVTGCITDGPLHNSGFRSIDTLKELEGTYSNRGDGMTSNNPICLYRIIWPNDYSYRCEDVDTIEVKVVGNNKIEVQAFYKTRLLQSGMFVEGKDFNVGSGKIILNSSSDSSGLRGGEQIIGVHTQKYILGIDMEGNGKLRNSESVAGLIFGFIPMAAQHNQDIRFNKLKNNKSVR